MLFIPILGSGVTFLETHVSLGFKVSIAEDDDSLLFLPRSECLFYGFRSFYEAQLTCGSP